MTYGPSGGVLAKAMEGSLGSALTASEVCEIEDGLPGSGC
jgi:hypothetical protein